MKALSVRSYREEAKKALPKDVFDYVDGAAGDEVTRRQNELSFDAISLRPLCLRDVSSTSTRVEILNKELAAPIMIGPTAFHQLADPAGEVATARAAAACGLPMVVSSMSNSPLETIAEQSEHDNLWMQCYIFRDRSITRDLVGRAERAGYKALVLTVGIPVHGKRPRDVENGFQFPPHLTLGNFVVAAHGKTLRDFSSSLMDPSVTWEDVEWLCQQTRLPVFIKGVLNPLDAERAAATKLSGIVVSNHGGRQLDTSEATISVLPSIASRVPSEMPVLMDGGVTRGTDVLKALALGADAVLLGKPIFWALTVGGEDGVAALLCTLMGELELAMQLSGCRTVAEVRQFGPDLCSTPSR